MEKEEMKKKRKNANVFKEKKMQSKYFWSGQKKFKGVKKYFLKN